MYTTLVVVENMNILNMAQYKQYRGNMSSRFSINSEANASELIENLEEMVPRY